MPEEVLFESETDRGRSDVASYLHTVAEKLDAGEPLRLAVGEESVTLDPPPRVTFEVKAEREGPADGPGELSVEFEIEWDEETDGVDGELTIE